MATTTKTKEIKIDETLDQFGPEIKITTPPKTTKDDLRDYQKTPEVNKLLEEYGSKSAAIRALQ
jgi:hypothetical protein